MSVSLDLLTNFPKMVPRLRSWLKAIFVKSQGPCPWCPVRVEFTGEPPRNQNEALIASLAGERKSTPLHWLQEQLAEALYRAELRRGGWATDIGIWGPAAFHREAGLILAKIRPEFCLYTLEIEFSHGSGEVEGTRPA